MTNKEIELVAKPVKDMYGTSMGTILGTITDIDGSIQTVGIDCGSAGLQQIPFEQLVIQKDVVIFIPKWRLDSQRLIREKGLVLRRLKALMDIVSENDEMKEDATIIHEKYKTKLASLDESERQIRERLDSRLVELDIQMKAAKTVIFDAKVQYKSNEILKETFEGVKKQAGVLLEHITHETSEIANVQRRIADLDMEIKETSNPHEQQHIEEPTVTYLANGTPDIQTKLPEAPTSQPVQDAHGITVNSDAVSNQQQQQQQVTATTTATTTTPTQQQQQQQQKSNDSTSANEQDWLSRMQAQ